MSQVALYTNFTSSCATVDAVTLPGNATASAETPLSRMEPLVLIGSSLTWSYPVATLPALTLGKRIGSVTARAGRPWHVLSGPLNNGTKKRKNSQRRYNASPRP